MSRRNNPAHRCAACRLHRTLCVCAACSPEAALETRTRVVVIVHHVEVRKPSNTGRLAAARLANSRLVVRGLPGDAAHPPDRACLDAVVGEPLVLFPREDAAPIERFAQAPGPFTLIVPDGSWRQAAKIRDRVAGLRGARCVSLPAVEPSRYRLRAEPHAHSLSTIEAIARALDVLEGERGPAVRGALEAALALLVERTLWARGVIGRHDLSRGLPDEAPRHDPRRLAHGVAPTSEGAPPADARFSGPNGEDDVSI